VTTLNLPGRLVAHRRSLDAANASSDGNARLRPLKDVALSGEMDLDLAPHAVEFWPIDKAR